MGNLNIGEEYLLYTQGDGKYKQQLSQKVKNIDLYRMSSSDVKNVAVMSWMTAREYMLVGVHIGSEMNESEKVDANGDTISP